MLLNLARQGIHIARAHMIWGLAPCFEGLARRSYRGIHVGITGGGNLHQGLAVGRVRALHILSTGRLNPLVLNKQPKALMLLKPSLDGCGSLWRGTVLHCLK